MRWSVRAVVIALLSAAGALWMVAAAERWWPACTWGDFDADACIKLQDHLYDYVAPSAPWAPIGDSAPTAGIALTLLSLGLALLPWLWVPHRPLVCLTAAVPALAVLMIGVLTWNAGLSGEAAADSGTAPAIVVWSFGLPVALAVAASTRRNDNIPQRTTRWRVVVVILITMSTPLAEALLTPMLVGYMSHDSTPWTGAWTGAFLIAAGIAAWPATRAPRIAVEGEPVRARA